MDGEDPAEDEVQVSVIPRERLRIDDLQTQIDEEGFELPRSRLGGEPWRLEPPGVQRLLDKIRERGVPLVEYAGVKPLLRDQDRAATRRSWSTRRRATGSSPNDPNSAEILKPYLRGQDMRIAGHPQLGGPLDDPSQVEWRSPVVLD